MITQPMLLVEDDENDVFFFQRAVTKLGIINPVQVAKDGQEAIDYLQGTGKFASRAEFPLPYLVLLDLKLPFVMGLDVLKWIRQQSGPAPIVVILSSSQEEKDITAAYALGANGYLVKPGESSKLSDIVRAINAFWLTHNTPPPNCLPHRGLAPADNTRPLSLAGHLRSPAHNSPGPAPLEVIRSDDPGGRQRPPSPCEELDPKGETPHGEPHNATARLFGYV